MHPVVFLQFPHTRTGDTTLPYQATHLALPSSSWSASTLTMPAGTPIEDSAIECLCSGSLGGHPCLVLFSCTLGGQASARYSAFSCLGAATFIQPWYLGNAGSHGQAHVLLPIRPSVLFGSAMMDARRACACASACVSTTCLHHGPLSFSPAFSILHNAVHIMHACMNQ